MPGLAGSPTPPKFEGTSKPPVSPIEEEEEVDPMNTNTTISTELIEAPAVD